MSTINPYESPLTESAEPAVPSPSAKVYVGGTIVPRSLAASGDALFACVLAVIAGAQMPEEDRLLQFAVMAVVWLGYYLVSECLFSRTPGKLLAGLVVLQLSGKRITVRQAVTRNLIRALEANPFFGLPAGLCIVFSRRRQRIGDRVAGTVVASVKQMRS
jgi:uncharacterized RDD family membrane protein YckC